jgi:hypothetical protein
MDGARKRSILLAASVLLAGYVGATPHVGRAQTADGFPEAMIGTLRTKATVETAEGRTIGCTIQYGAFIRDWGDRQGRASYVVGNFRRDEEWQRFWVDPESCC